MRPTLRPGTHVLRRGTGQLQVGIDPGSALVLPDTAPVRESLRLLGTSTELDGHDDLSTVGLLTDHEHLLDAGQLAPLLARDDLDPGAAAALARAAGPDAGSVHATRRQWRTRTLSFGHRAGAGLREQFLALTSRAGISEAASRSTSPIDTGILLGVGEPQRELLDDWSRSATPYALVRMVEGRAVLGPFVVPGTTACLRCIDAHCADVDPSWPLLLRQYATASARDRADGVPEPLDPALAALALAWAARDLATYVDGGRPSTWSTTITLAPQLSHLETRHWLRHPACSCTWD